MLHGTRPHALATVAETPPLRLAAAGGMGRAALRLVLPLDEHRAEGVTLEHLQQALVDELRELGGMAVVA